MTNKIYSSTQLFTHNRLHSLAQMNLIMPRKHPKQFFCPPTPSCQSMMRTISSFQVLSCFSKVSLSIAVIAMIYLLSFTLVSHAIHYPKVEKVSATLSLVILSFENLIMQRKHSAYVKVVPKLYSGVQGVFTQLRYPRPKSLCLVLFKLELVPILQNKHCSIRRSHTTKRSLCLMSKEV